MGRIEYYTRYIDSDPPMGGGVERIEYYTHYIDSDPSRGRGARLRGTYRICIESNVIGEREGW